MYFLVTILQSYIHVCIMDYSMAYPGVFVGCPETPPPGQGHHFLNQGVALTFSSHLNLRLLETPLRPTLDKPLDYYILIK